MIEVKTEKIVLKIEENDNTKILKIELGGPITVNDAVPAIEELKKVEQQIAGSKGLVISGRAPIWLYAAIVAELQHLVPFIAVYDPKLAAAVVVATHTTEYNLFETIPCSHC